MCCVFVVVSGVCVVLWQKERGKDKTFSTRYQSFFPSPFTTPYLFVKERRSVPILRRLLTVRNVPFLTLFSVKTPTLLSCSRSFLLFW